MRWLSRLFGIAPGSPDTDAMFARLEWDAERELWISKAQGSRPFAIGISGYPEPNQALFPFARTLHADAQAIVAKVTNALQAEAERDPPHALTLRMLQLELVDLSNEDREATIYFKPLGDAVWHCTLSRGRVSGFASD
jgi:hypothetical protein